MKPEILQYLQQFGPYIWEFCLAVIFLFTGMVFSRRELSKHEKKRVLGELFNIQNEIFARANDPDWGEDNTYRKVWMISLFFERVRTLRVMLDGRHNFSDELSLQFETYEDNLRHFARAWARARRRTPSYWDKYQSTFESFHKLVMMIDKHYVAANQIKVDHLKNEDFYRPALS